MFLWSVLGGFVVHVQVAKETLFEEQLLDSVFHRTMVGRCKLTLSLKVPPCFKV